MTHRPLSTACIAVVLALIVVFPRPGAAQGAPATPDDTPTLRVGMTLYSDYTYTRAPEAIDAEGNTYRPSAFNVTRSYLNFTGNISHLVAYRITPDIARETGSGSTLNGSLTFRIKYAFAQINLDDWMEPGSWVRLGIQQTPWVDFEENIYRYRFQGTVFVEREGFMSSSDAGASFHYNLPSNYGDVHAGMYNGENYNRTEVNDQKAFQARGTIRPFANGAAVVRGLRGHAFFIADHYLRNADRHRFVASATYEHPRLHAGFDYLAASDRSPLSPAEINARGYSLWITPRAPNGLEGFLRYDHLVPDRSRDAKRNRTIAGLAYWFPHQGTVSAALLLDYEHVKADGFTPVQPTQKRAALHGLVSF